jgi:hypothetical protein
MKSQAKHEMSATDAALILATGILKLALEISEDEPEYIVNGPARRRQLKISEDDEPEYVVIGPARRQRLKNSRGSTVKPKLRLITAGDSHE